MCPVVTFPLGAGAEAYACYRVLLNLTEKTIIDADGMNCRVSISFFGQFGLCFSRALLLTVGLSLSLSLSLCLSLSLSLFCNYRA